MPLASSTLSRGHVSSITRPVGFFALPTSQSFVPETRNLRSNSYQPSLFASSALRTHSFAPSVAQTPSRTGLSAKLGTYSHLSSSFVRPAGSVAQATILSSSFVRPAGSVAQATILSSSFVRPAGSVTRATSLSSSFVRPAGSVARATSLSSSFVRPAGSVAQATSLLWNGMATATPIRSPTSLASNFSKHVFDLGEEVHKSVVKVPTIVYRDQSIPVQHTESRLKVVEKPQTVQTDKLVMVPRIETQEISVEVPTTQVKEVVREVPKIEYRENLIPNSISVVQENPVYVPKIETVERILEVPMTQAVEIPIEVPKTRMVEVDVEVPRIDTQERLVEVPKIELVERIVEVPQVKERVDRERQIAKIIENVRVHLDETVGVNVVTLEDEIPQIQSTEKLVEVPQVQLKERSVHVPWIQTKEKIVEVPQVQMVDRLLDIPQIVMMDAIVEIPQTDNDMSSGNPTETEYQILNALQGNLSDNIYVKHIFGDNRELQVTGAKMIRKLLSFPEIKPPIKEVVAVPGLIERFVSFLYVKDSFTLTLLYDSVWILTNIASGDSSQTAAVVDAKAIPALMDLFGQSDLKLTEEVIWALSNIAGDWTGYRDNILEMNGMNKLLQAMNEAYKQQGKDAQTFIETGVWCCSNFCRGQPIPDFHLVKECIPFLVCLIQAEWCDSIIIDSVRALGYLADGNDTNILAICRAGVCSISMDLIEKSNPDLIAAVIRLIGNIVTADDPRPVELMIMAGVVAKVRPLINHKEKNVRKEACWTFSNISAGKPDQVQFLIDSGVMVDLLAVLDVDDMDIRKECVWCLTHVCTQKDPSQVGYLMRIGIVPPLMRFLEDSCQYPEKETILEAFVNILETYAELDLADGKNKYAEIMECAGIVKILEQLKLDPNRRLEEMAFTLLVDYFDHNPGEMDPSNFEFGTVNGVPNFGNDYDPDDQVMQS